MKTPVLVLTMILFLITYTAQAQSPLKFKYKSSPAYSTHNYKQPDKAEMVKKYKLEDLKNFVHVEPLLIDAIIQRNYKTQACKTPPISNKARETVVVVAVSTTPHKELYNSVNIPIDENH